MTTTLGEIIETRRKRRGLTQERLAELISTDIRQLRKWIKDEVKPTLDKADVLSFVLGITMDQLIGRAPLYDLSGTWFAAWQTSRAGVATIDRHELEAWHDGAEVRLDATGDYRWHADLTIEGDDLGGRFRSMEAGYTTRGAVNFQVHPDADRARGDWTGHFVDGYGGKGRGALARDPAVTDKLLAWLVKQEGPYTEKWPNI